ncbi:hypothetical protein F511_11752 [Dorcoceras hygrometricum]|uniref:Uncharacterized protein n=1 Tax=Dorcoceras hygrometricum TaxID=472368 RepID=A0A2Z7B9H7_9LAMI|nr:hypothetical protein F511_11752 [Dorcoceras hygrometricum]
MLRLENVQVYASTGFLIKHNDWEHCDVLSMQMDSDLVIYRTTLVRTFQVSTRSVLGKWVYLVTLVMSLFDLQDICIAIGSLATLDLPMVVDLIGIYGLKGPYCITDSACKNQLVVVSVQYGPFNPYIPIKSTTIGKSRVAIDPIAMHTSWRSNSDIASVTSLRMNVRGTCALAAQGRRSLALSSARCCADDGRRWAATSHDGRPMISALVARLDVRWPRGHGACWPVVASGHAQEAARRCALICTTCMVAEAAAVRPPSDDDLRADCCDS